jgi:hypothetical protein
VTIHGSLIGGEIYGVGANIRNVTISGNIVGSSISGTDGEIAWSGCIFTHASIGSVWVGGSVVAGHDDSTSGYLYYGTSILATQSIGSITVKGNVIGSTGPNGNAAVVFSASGAVAPTPTSNMAIGKINIGGRVENAQIIAGYDFDFGANNGNAQIGAVSVGGDWIASSIVAGIQNSIDSLHFGDGHDSVIGGVANSIAKIASITIGGTVTGTPVSGDHFAFESHAIGNVKIGGNTVLPGTQLSPLTGDVTLQLV